jgi:hypothetical protein
MLLVNRQHLFQGIQQQLFDTLPQQETLAQGSVP